MSKSNKYDKIINLPHHVSSTRPHMSMIDRAAQFSPFAALTGYDAAVRETARLTEQKIELDEYEKAALDQRILLLQEHLKELPEVTITHFVPDERKDGGKYVSITEAVKKIDTYEKQIVLVDKSKIPIENILSIEGELFRILETEN
jgi:hypothetical protein